MTFLQAGKLTEAEAREYLEKLRWPNGPVCPHCKATEVTRLQGESARPGVMQCNGCREQFTVTVGGVMEDTHIPLQKWVMAFCLICSSKKRVSALQLQRNLELGSYRTAWHLAHRIRHAMKDGFDGPKLSGTVEADETYVGGKPRHKGQSKRGRGTAKQPVMVIVERDGNSHCKPIPSVDGDTLKSEIVEHVETESVIVTDENPAYNGLDAAYAGHETVKHSAKEYARTGKDGMSINSNTAESFFALLKRGHYGTFHQFSKKHMHRYCNEFSFRWDHRKVSDAVRTNEAMRGIEGKRLFYKTPKPSSVDFEGNTKLEVLV